MVMSYKICIYNTRLRTRLLIRLFILFFIWFVFFFFTGAFRLYDVDNDGFITRDEMYNIVDAIYQMVVSVQIYTYIYLL